MSPVSSAPQFGDIGDERMEHAPDRGFRFDAGEHHRRCAARIAQEFSEQQAGGMGDRRDAAKIKN